MCDIFLKTDFFCGRVKSRSLLNCLRSGKQLCNYKNNVILIGTTNRADVLDEALVRRFTFKHYVKELSREEVEVLCRKFLTSVQYPIELGTVETITDAIYAKNKTPTVNDVVSSCTDNIIEWIITENKL